MNLLLEESIQAPKRAVWEILTDLKVPPAASTQSKLFRSSAPVRSVKARFRETRVMFGKEAVEEMVITHFEAPTTYTVEADSCGMHFASTYSLHEVAGTTNLRLEIRTRPTTFLAKAISPLGFLMAGKMKKLLAQDNVDIKRAAEALALSTGGAAR